MTLFDQAFNKLLKVEGEEYTDYPLDKGGPTKFGITLKTYNDFTGLNVNVDVIKSLTIATARSIYKAFIWHRLQLDRIGATHPEIALAYFDQAVNRGSFGATRMIQQSVNKFYGYPRLIDDGILGEKTLSEIEKIPKKDLCLSLFKVIQLGYIRVVKNNPDQIVFLEGWINRTHEILNQILQGV